MNSQEKMKEREVKALENIFKAKFNVRFPRSYREFLLEHGSMEIAGFTILGIPEEKESKKPKQAAVEKPKPTIRGRLTSPLLSDFESFLTKGVSEFKKRKQEQEQKEKKNSLTAKMELSVVEATQLLENRRPELADKKLIPIFFKQDLHTKRQK